MWRLYDELIAGIPEDLIADEVFVGQNKAFVRTGAGCGIGHIFDVESRLPMFSGSFIGRPLKEVAQCIKSWNLIEASVGAAAINAYYNSPETAAGNNVVFSNAKHFDDRMNDPFITYQQVVRDKNVAVVGHFPYIDALFAPVCNMSIFEVDPTDGEYPYSAIEYLLPEQDFVFITCGSLVNKTLPRILELSKNSKNILVGPATPMAPVLFKFGVDDLSGFVIKDMSLAANIVSGSQYGSIYSSGQKVHLQQL